MQLCGSLNILWHWLSLGLEWKLTFSSLVATAEFSKFAVILSTVLSQHHLLGFEINSSARIPSPLLAVFIVMLPKAHCTSHSRMSGSRWVTTLSWLSGSLRPFWYSFSVYSYRLLISSASIRSLLFLSYSTYPCVRCSLGISGFLEKISSLSHSVTFLFFALFP